MRKNSILAIGNINSNITQINIEGLSKDEVEQLCLRLINKKMNSLRADAAEEFKNQIQEFVELFYRRLAEIAKNTDLLNRLKTPAVQFALDESLLIYSKHPSLEEKELQVELLIDKIQTDDNTTKGIIIDAARVELCNLTNAQVSMLAFLVCCRYLETPSSDKDELFRFFSDIGPILTDIDSMNLTVAEPVEAPLSLFTGYYAEALRQAQGPPMDRAVALINPAGCNRADTAVGNLNVIANLFQIGACGRGLNNPA